MKAHKLNMIQMQIGNTEVNSFESLKNKNKIINGNFDIWQRATSQTSSGYGSDDRWRNYYNGTTMTTSRQTFTLGQTNVPNEPTYYSRSVVTSSAGTTNFAMKDHRIEGVRTLAGKNCTLSFWAKADASKNIAIEFKQNFGTGGSPSGEVICHSEKVLLSTSWQKFTVTASIASISGKTIGSNGDDHLRCRFWFDAGSTYNNSTDSLGQQSGTFDIAQVQLEEGDNATPFEIRPIGYELFLCWRYYYTFTMTSLRAFAVARCSNSGVDMLGGLNLFPVEMRTSPTVTNLSPTSNARYYKTDTQIRTEGTNGALTALANTTRFHFQESVSGINDDMYVCVANGTITLEFDAEL